MDFVAIIKLRMTRVLVRGSESEREDEMMEA